MNQDEYSRPATIIDLKTVIQSLNENNVMIIGLMAVIIFD